MNPLITRARVEASLLQDARYIRSADKKRLAALIRDLAFELEKDGQALLHAAVAMGFPAGHDQARRLLSFRLTERGRDRI